MNKQIEEMALALSEGCCGKECDCIEGDKFNCHLLYSASLLYNAGYRKQSENLVEVVRCKDCKFYRQHKPPIEDFDGWCSANDIECDTDFFCQYGAKMKGGEADA